MGIKLTQKEVIRRIRKTHGNTYDLSKFVYTTQRSKSIFICDIHGEFTSQPKEVWGGTGCPECGKDKFIKPISKWENVLVKLIKLHGEEYEYFHETYKGVSKNIKVKCKTHNHIWNVRVMELLKGQGCPKCRYIKSGENLVLKVPEFIERSKKTHGDKYDYSKVHQFKTQEEDVLIICPTHGEFEQNPRSHYTGSGCPRCWEDIRSEVLTSPWEDVLKSFREVHKNKYEYNRSDYENSSSKLRITCPKHGEFRQDVTLHKYGSGCPVCNSSRGEKDIEFQLRDLGVGYEHQKKFPELSNRYRYDFYIPDINTIVEYNGVQHYEPIEYFGGEKSLKNTQRRDKIKKQYCLDNGINYEIIRYDEETKVRVFEILKKYSKS